MPSHRFVAIGALLVLNLAQAQKHPPNVPGANLPDIAGVLPWSQLEKVGTYKAGDGRLLPKYPDNVLALDNRQVLLQGFMMPLEAGAKQSHFLLTVTTPGCAYCLPAGPEGIVEINATTPIKFTYKPIVLSGQMHVLKSDPMGLYYRLRGDTCGPMTLSFPCRSLCILAGTVAWMCTNGAHALDLDVIVNIHERTIQATQACQALRRGALPATPQAYYLRGLCLAYGPGGVGYADDGVAALRRAASLDAVEAQMALGDYFQASRPPRIADALYWYERARQLGDARAAGRAAHLGNRLGSGTVRPSPPADTIVDPAPRELQALYREGYHCHAVFGEQWCHIADDL